MTVGGTGAYEREFDLPPLVRAAVELAVRSDFPYSCLPGQGRLLAALAYGRRGGRIGETGTGCGVGLAWMVSGTDRSTEFVSVERDPDRAAAVERLFADQPNVTVLCDDWSVIADYAPFDLLFADGGGSGKPGSAALEPTQLLLLGGTMVVDDFTPMAEWPPRFDGQPDVARLQWLTHPYLTGVEVTVGPQASCIVATRHT